MKKIFYFWKSRNVILFQFAIYDPFVGHKCINEISGMYNQM